MFPEKYKHPSKQQKTAFRRLADKAVSIFKRNVQTEQANAWIV